MKLQKRKNILIKRTGSKDNDHKYYLHLLPSDVVDIVEPFGGSFSLIRRIYCDVELYNLYVNDLDPALYYFYTNPEEYERIMGEVRDTVGQCYAEGVKNAEVKKRIYELEYDKPIIDYMMQTCFRNGMSLVKRVKNNDYTDQIELMKNINFTSECYKVVIERHRTNPDAFIYIDPPYMFSDNSGYIPTTEDTDCTDIYFYLLDILEDPTTTAKIMIIINKLKILEKLYGKFIKMEYNKTYQMSKKKAVHLVICNY